LKKIEDLEKKLEEKLDLFEIKEFYKEFCKDLFILLDAVNVIT
jgi:hypothetical protein